MRPHRAENSPPQLRNGRCAPPGQMSFHAELQLITSITETLYHPAKVQPHIPIHQRKHGGSPPWHPGFSPRLPSSERRPFPASRAIPRRPTQDILPQQGKRGNQVTPSWRGLRCESIQRKPVFRSLRRRRRSIAEAATRDSPEVRGKPRETRKRILDLMLSGR